MKKLKIENERMRSQTVMRKSTPEKSAKMAQYLKSHIDVSRNPLKKIMYLKKNAIVVNSLVHKVLLLF